MSVTAGAGRRSAGVAAMSVFHCINVELIYVRASLAFNGGSFMGRQPSEAYRAPLYITKEMMAT